MKQLTELSAEIRRARKRRMSQPREMPRYKDDIDVRYHRHRHYYDIPAPAPAPRPHHHHHHHHHQSSSGKPYWDYEDETYREREIIWDSKGRRWYR